MVADDEVSPSGNVYSTPPQILAFSLMLYTCVTERAVVIMLSHPLIVVNVLTCVTLDVEVLPSGNVYIAPSHMLAFTESV
jgi:hypothetical protein